MFLQNAPILLERLLLTKLSEEEVSIGYAIQGELNMSLLTWDEYAKDDDLSLCYHADGHVDLCYSYYDEDYNTEGGWINHVYVLNAEEIDSLPEALPTIMAAVLHTGNSVKITAKQLSK